MPYAKRYRRKFARARGRYRRRRVQQRRRRQVRRSSRRPLSKRAAKAVKVIARQAVVNMSDVKQNIRDIGEFNGSPADFGYGQPQYLTGASWAQGTGTTLMTSHTACVNHIGSLAMGTGIMLREGTEVYLKGIRISFSITTAPSSMVRDTVARVRLVSTTNDPGGQNLGFIPNAPAQNRLYHIPTLLCPPSDTFGMLKWNDQGNLGRTDLDVREFKIHWTKTYKFRPNASVPLRTIKDKVSKFWKNPRLVEYGGTHESHRLGRKYFLLWNSNILPGEGLATNKQCPLFHARIFTYFADRL